MSSSNWQSWKCMSPIISPIGKRKNKRQRKQATTTTTKRLSSGLVGLMISIKKCLTKMASCFFRGGLEAARKGQKSMWNSKHSYASWAFPGLFRNLILTIQQTFPVFSSWVSSSTALCSISFSLALIKKSVNVLIMRVNYAMHTRMTEIQ